METSSMGVLIQHLRRMELLRDGAGSTDGQLLEAYTSRQDQVALAALVQRHGPMVWGVCRRVLGNYHDAEDAFQATFLVLVRKAASVTPREMIANWLYGVAHQTALKARATAGTRKGRERKVAEMPEPAAAEPAHWDELLPMLDEELSRLPDNYRAVVVLCDLEGKTRTEAARQLGVPEGTVGGWVARARVMLAERLTRRGVTLSGGALAAILSQHVASAGVPASVVSNAITVASLFAAGQAAGAVRVEVAALAEGVVKAMSVSKLKTAVGVLVVAMCLIGVGTAVVLGQPPEPPEVPAPAPKKAAPVPRQADAKEAAVKAMQERLQGTWKCVAAHTGGVKSEPDVTFTIKGNSWENKVGGRVLQSGTFKLNDLDDSPKQIEWHFSFSVEEGDKDKSVFHGIFMLDGDSLCCAHCNAAVYPRPVTFFTQPDDGCFSLMYKRVAK
jgi:RNA polymerase sigma factor (sigma-70 family)